jgi:hypothetical protein
MVYLTMPKASMFIMSGNGIDVPLCKNMSEKDLYIDYANDWNIDNNDDGTFCLYIMVDKHEEFDPQGKHMYCDPVVIGKEKAYLSGQGKDILLMMTNPGYNKLKFINENGRYKTHLGGYLTCIENSYNKGRFDLVVINELNDETLQSFEIVESL